MSTPRDACRKATERFHHHLAAKLDVVVPAHSKRAEPGACDFQHGSHHVVECVSKSQRRIAAHRNHENQLFQMKDNASQRAGQRLTTPQAEGLSPTSRSEGAADIQQTKQQDTSVILHDKICPDWPQMRQCTCMLNVAYFA